MSNDNFPPASKFSRWLRTTDWLAEHLRDSNLAVVDGTYFLPTHNRDARAEYRSAHIPGAVFFDIEAISDHSTDLPHMLPGTTQFGDEIGALGSAMATPSWFTTTARYSPRPGSGGHSASSAPNRSTYSMADCRNGRPKAARLNPATPSGRGKSLLPT